MGENLWGPKASTIPPGPVALEDEARSRLSWAGRLVGKLPASPGRASSLVQDRGTPSPALMATGGGRAISCDRWVLGSREIPQVALPSRRDATETDKSLGPWEPYGLLYWSGCSGKASWRRAALLSPEQ